MAKDTKDGQNHYVGPEDVEKTFKPDSPDNDWKETVIRNLHFGEYINYVTFCKNYITLFKSEATTFVVVIFIG